MARQGDKETGRHGDAQGYSAPCLVVSESPSLPLVATAVHAGHAVRPEVEALLRLDDAQRRYEEDPYTDRWTSIAPTRVIGRRSRFEFDLNRPRDRAVYLRPEDAWGLDLWRSPPPAEVVERSLAAYDEFYATWRGVLEQLLERHSRVVVFDLHSYNHRRAEKGVGHLLPERPAGCYAQKVPDTFFGAADPALNPEVNLGTATLDRPRWARVVDRWLAEMASYDFLGRRLNVRENVKFYGGHLPKWTHETFGDRVCVLAIEVKKIFMDEWTGQLDPATFAAVHGALGRAAAGVNEELRPSE